MGVIDIFISFLLSCQIRCICIMESRGGFMENTSESAQKDLQAILEKVNIEDAFAKTVGMRVVELSPGYE